MHEGAVSARLGLAGIPSLSESTMIARDSALALYEDARVHFQHLSAVESVQALAAAKEAGARVSGEASPHHLTLTDDMVRTLDSRFKMNPPLRSEADRRALVEGLRSGVIDCVATDHAPHAVHEKEVPFEQAPMGTTGLETAFAALYTELVLPGELELATVIERMTAGAGLYEPAHAADRRRRGRQPVPDRPGGDAGRSAPMATSAARPTRASTAAPCTAGCMLDARRRRRRPTAGRCSRARTRRRSGAGAGRRRGAVDGGPGRHRLRPARGRSPV